MAERSEAELDPTRFARADRPGERPGPLSGVRVIDVSRVLSGPFAARLMADLGAEVIKVEPPEGDALRFSFPEVNGIATFFTQQNCGKRNVSIDLDQPGGAELVADLIDTADVVVENFRPGVLARHGIGWEQLSVRNPRLVWAAISGYGQTGEWRDRGAYGPTINAESGLTAAQNLTRAGIQRNDLHSHGDVYGSWAAFGAVMAALYSREVTGRGQFIDVSMLAAVLASNEHAHWWLRDRSVVGDGENESPSYKPDECPVLRCADNGAVCVAASPVQRRFFSTYAEVTGLSALLDDPRFATVALRRSHYEELIAELEDWSRPMSAAEIERAFAVRRIPVGMVRTARELASTRWAQERQAFVRVDDRAGGAILVPDSPWRFSEGEASLRGTSSYRGEDNREVLTTVLGLDARTIDDLAARGVIVSSTR